MKDALRGHARGASTISQQLVKNMFRVRTEYSTGLLGYIPGVKILIMKLKEMIIATELEMFCTKNEILTMYANTVDFGSNAYGIKTAAKNLLQYDARQAQNRRGRRIGRTTQSHFGLQPQEQSPQCPAASQRCAAQYVHTRQPHASRVQHTQG